MADADVIAGITAAVQVGAVSADVVADRGPLHAATRAVELGGSDSDRHSAARRTAQAQRAVSLTQRRLADPAAVIAGLPPDRTPLARVDAYDVLLPKHHTPTAATTSTQENASWAVVPATSITPTLRRRRGLTQEARPPQSIKPAGGCGYTPCARFSTRRCKP
jgi:hypothetical protein